MNSRAWRIGLAIVLAILGAFWFEVDFSSSHHAGNAGVGQVAVAGTSAAAPRHPLPALSALGGFLTGGVVTSLPPWGILAVAAAYLLGRVSFTRWSVRR